MLQLGLGRMRPGVPHRVARGRIGAGAGSALARAFMLL